MISSDLSFNFDSWTKIDTWYKSHPLDDQRFHKSLDKAISSHSGHLSFKDFKRAITDSVKRNGNYSLAMNSYIDERARNAEQIAEYINNIKE